jgi:hypothetical protein
MTVVPEDLVGSWIHAHEEDTESELVFRPAGRELPPSRGRRAIELRDDGTLVQVAPGPVDVPTEAHGSWELSEDGVLTCRPAEGQAWEAQVIRAEPDRLVLSRPH